MKKIIVGITLTVVFGMWLSELYSIGYFDQINTIQDTSSIKREIQRKVQIKKLLNTNQSKKIINHQSSDFMPRTPRQIRALSKGEEGIFSINVDQCQFAIFEIVTTEELDRVILIDPKGEQFTERQLVQLSAKIDKISGPIANILKIKIPDVLPGTWQVKLALTGYGMADVRCAIANNKNIFLHLNKSTYRVGEEFLVRTTFKDSSNPIRDAKVSVDLLASNQEKQFFELFDDGVHFDSIAGDGIYANKEAVSLPPGYTIVSVSARKGLTDRGTESRIQILSAENTIEILKVSGTILECKDRDHCRDLQINLTVNFKRKAHYEIYGILRKDKQIFIANAFFSTTLIDKDPILGNHDIALTFKGDQIYKSGVSGPYQILLSIEEMNAQFELVNDVQFDNAYITRPYSFKDFR